MGNALHRDTEDGTTGLTEKERRLIHESWQNFTKKHPDYGILLFTALFVKHPEYQKLFKKFKDKELGTLMRDPIFTDHASTAGRQITAMVDSLETPGILLEIITKNIEFHPIGSGVMPEHYVEMGRVLIEVLRADEDERTTRATIKAWEKLLHLMNQKTTEVYAEEVKLNKLKNVDSYDVEYGMSTTDIMASSNKSVEKVDRRKQPSSAVPHHKRSSASELSSNKERPREAASHDKVGVEHGTASGSTEQATTSEVPPKDKSEAHSHLHASEREHPREATSHDKAGTEHGAASGSTEQATTSGMPPKDKAETHSHLHASGRAHPREAASHDKAGVEHGAASGSTEHATSGMPPEDKSETLLHVTERSALKTHSKDHLGHKRHVPPSTGSS